MNKINMNDLENLLNKGIEQTVIKMELETGDELEIAIDKEFANNKVSLAMSQLVEHTRDIVQEIDKNQVLSDDEKKERMKENMNVALFPIILRNFTNIEVPVNDDFRERDKGYTSLMAYLVSIKDVNGKHILNNILEAIPQTEINKLVSAINDVTKMINELGEEASKEK